MNKNYYLHKNWLIIANAGANISCDFNKLLTPNTRVLVCDGAYELIKKYYISVDIILGDFDSISMEELAFVKYNKLIKCIETPDQNKTDLEKAIEYISKYNPKSIRIINALENRLDHTLYNLQLIKQFFNPEQQITFIHQKQALSYEKNALVTLSGDTGKYISLFGAPSALITANGLKYPMDNHLIQQNKFSSVSNELNKKTAYIEIKGSAFLINDLALFKKVQYL